MFTQRSARRGRAKVVCLATAIAATAMPALADPNADSCLSSEDACFAFGLGGGQYLMTQRAFLAREFLGSGDFELGLFEPGSRWSAETLRLSYDMPYGPVDLPDSMRPSPDDTVRVQAELMLSRAWYEQYVPSIDPTAGYGLGIPGIEGGASGAFLPAYPNNIVEDALYEGNLTWGQLTLNLARERSQPYGNDSLSVGLRYSYLDQEESFHGQIPGYLSDFQYNFDAQSNAFGIHVGYRRSFELGGGGDSGWQTQAHLSAAAGVAYVQAEGDASLMFVGFLDSIAPSYGNYSENGFRPYASFEAGITTTNPRTGLSLGASLTYDIRPWGVGFSGNGTDPYTMELQTMQAWNLMVGASVRF